MVQGFIQIQTVVILSLSNAFHQPNGNQQNVQLLEVVQVEHTLKVVSVNHTLNAVMVMFGIQTISNVYALLGLLIQAISA